MNIHIPDILEKKDFSCFTELFFIVPYIGPDLYNNILQNANWWNEGLFTKLYFNGSIHKRVSLPECDIVCIPFKYSQEDARITTICSEAQKYNKKVIAIFNDDYTGSFNLPVNLILFRTSAYKSKLGRNERILPVLVPDHSSIVNINPAADIRASVGFCGHAEGIRGRILQSVENVLGSSQCDFIIRPTFYHHTGQVNIFTRREYCKNIADNLFTLCIRGAGNFSYRFYEALSMGRIPILIDTDNALPFDQEIFWDNYIIKIQESDIDKLPSLIKSCKINPIEVRRLWEEYFSPEGYTNNFYKDL